MMQKEEKIVMVLLVMAVLSLIIGYFGFSTQIKTYSPDSKIGERVHVEGTILSKQMTKTGDNLILVLSNPKLNIFVAKNSGAKDVYDAVEAGDRVGITGKVSEFNNLREIVIESAGDIVKLGV